MKTNNIIYIKPRSNPTVYAIKSMDFIFILWMEMENIVMRERERDEFEGDEITVVSHGNYLTSLLNKDPPCVFV